MFLVDDHQAEARELYIVRQQLVRADHNVDRTFRHTLDRLRDFLAGTEARQFRNLHRPVGKAVGKSLRMLFRQQRGRCEDRDLLAAHDGDEGGAQRNFGLAEADVATDQPVHRFAASHVLDHGVDRGALVRRLLEAETLREGFIVARGILEGMTFARGAARVQVQQFGGGISNLLRSFLLRLFPLAGAEHMQRRIVGRCAGIARNHMQLRYRHVQLGFLRILEVQEFSLAFTKVHAQQAHVAADAVIHMHDRVADLQLRQVAHHRLDLRDGFLFPASDAAAGAGVQLGFGNEGQAVQLEARMQWRDAKH